MTLQWRIYYGDGSTVDNLSHSPFEVPTTNVQAVILVDQEVGRIVMHGADYYWWRDEEWYACMDHASVGLWDYLMNNPGPCKVLFGRTLPNQVFHDVLQRAVYDEDFPAKSARNKRG